MEFSWFLNFYFNLEISAFLFSHDIMILLYNFKYNISNVIYNFKILWLSGNLFISCFLSSSEWSQTYVYFSFALLETICLSVCDCSSSYFYRLVFLFISVSFFYWLFINQFSVSQLSLQQGLFRKKWE